MIDRTIIERFTKVIWNTSNRGLAAIAYLARVDQPDALLIYGTTDFDLYFTEPRLLTFLKESFDLATREKVKVTPFMAQRLHQVIIEWPTGRLLVTVQALQTLETAVRWGLAGDLSQTTRPTVVARLKLLGALQQAEILWENQDELSRLQQILTPMPVVSKQSLIQFWQQEFHRTAQVLVSPFMRPTPTGYIQLGEELVNSMVILLLVAADQYGTGATITTTELAALVAAPQLVQQINAFYHAVTTAEASAVAPAVAALAQQIATI